jgi:prevent-host-death family protein
MRTINMHEARTKLARLVDQAAKGESLVIARAGKPLVKMTALDGSSEPQRLGFLVGEIEVPDDFDQMGESEITAVFGTEG